MTIHFCMPTLKTSGMKVFFFQCIELLGAGCLPDEMMVDVLRILNKLLTEHFERATERHQKRNDEDYDEVNEKHVSCYYKAAEKMKRNSK